MADYHGLVVRTKGGPAGFSWTDIEKVRDFPAFMVLRLREGTFVKTKANAAWSGNTIWLPTLFLEGGAQGLMNAIAHVRPDLVRHWWPDITLKENDEDDGHLAMVGFGSAPVEEEEDPKLHIRGQSVAMMRR